MNPYPKYVEEEGRPGSLVYNPLWNAWQLGYLEGKQVAARELTEWISKGLLLTFTARDDTTTLDVVMVKEAIE